MKSLRVKELLSAIVTIAVGIVVIIFQSKVIFGLKVSIWFGMFCVLYVIGWEITNQIKKNKENKKQIEELKEEIQSNKRKNRSLSIEIFKKEEELNDLKELGQKLSSSFLNLESEVEKREALKDIQSIFKTIHGPKI